MQVSVTVFDVQEKRKEWKKTIRPDMVEHLVFLDESGVNTNLTRLYGRALSSQRAVDHAPLNTPQTTTVLSSIRLNGEKAFTTYQGGTTGERFVQYLKETLLPTLKPGDIVVMDNMRSHHVKAVREVLEEKGMKVLYLPPYSPDLNPIEKMWSKMKALLRGWKVRSLDLLPDAVRMALDSVSQLIACIGLSLLLIVSFFEDCYSIAIVSVNISLYLRTSENNFRTFTSVKTACFP